MRQVFGLYFLNKSIADSDSAITLTEPVITYWAAG